jgi:hypothetical protein
MLLSIDHQNHRSKKITKKSTRESTIVRRRWRVDAQTEHMHHRPECGDDVDALGWGVPVARAMVGAKAAWCHGCGEKQKSLFAKGVLVPSMFVRKIA